LIWINWRIICNTPLFPIKIAHQIPDVILPPAAAASRFEMPLDEAPRLAEGKL
jgi:hypothetical protein